MRKNLRKYILIFLGLLFVVLGVIGAVLPILPTTPFLILALSCFANSSPRFHQMLLHNRWFGPSLQQWEANRTIARSTKIKAMLLITLTFAISIGVMQDKLGLQLGLFSLGCVLLLFLWRVQEATAVE